MRPSCRVNKASATVVWWSFGDGYQPTAWDRSPRWARCIRRAATVAGYRGVGVGRVAACRVPFDAEAVRVGETEEAVEVILAGGRDAQRCRRRAQRLEGDLRSDVVDGLLVMGQVRGFAGPVRGRPRALVPTVVELGWVGGQITLTTTVIGARG